MKVTLNLIVSLVLAATIVVSVFTYYEVRREKERLSQEYEIRSAIVMEGLKDDLNRLLKLDSAALLRIRVRNFTEYDHSLIVALIDLQGNSIVSSDFNFSELPESITHIRQVINRQEKISGLASVDGKQLYIYSAPIKERDKLVGVVTIVHNDPNISANINNIWQTNFIHLIAQVMLIIFITVLVVRFNIVKPVIRAARWMKNMRTGKGVRHEKIPAADMLKPLADEAALLVQSLSSARASAKEEARLRLQSESIWTAERLKEYVRKEIGNKNIVVVSNREPYMHIKQGSKVECVVPPGGLVTALDPILKACGGVWIASGTGEADKETSDSSGKLRVPIEEPAYLLRRIFLSKEEEEGYYYGFSNEGLWPLCHITHTRPTFRLEDWNNYQIVNMKFADAVLEEIQNEEAPLILIQDYHFALLPALIKAKRPDAHVALFWHIPWPNPEVFGICPWQKEILLGLLGADLIGFHIQFHCNNFLDTIDRFIEAKINREHFAVERQGGITTVKPFPISIEHSTSAQNGKQTAQVNKSLKELVYKQIGFSPQFMGVGVDRIDYTKGIVERFTAVERFLEKYQDYVGKFTFVELGAPSRTHIGRYKELLEELDQTSDRINRRFQSPNWKPIVFLKAQHSHNLINIYYRISNLCMVTSLHDGMNLVAKEFVSSRNDEDGVLILSEFTGAARELNDAIIINPYSIEDVADAMFSALTMESEERERRMKRMRSLIREKNVYNWAANIITDLANLQLATAPAG